MLRKRIVLALMMLMMVIPVKTMAASEAKVLELSLDNALELAFKNNKQLQDAEQQVIVAETVVDQAKGGFFPTVSYRAIHDRSNVPQYEVGPLNYGKTDFIAGINATLPLYTGGKLINSLELAKLQREIVKDAARQVKQKLNCEVKQAYYQVWLAQKAYGVQLASYNNLETHAARVKGFYEAGVASRYALLQAEVQRDTMKPAVLDSENQLALAKLNLATIIGLSQEQEYEIHYNSEEVVIPKEVTLALDQILTEAYENRPELQQLEKAAEVQRRQTELAKAGYKPTLGLSVGYNGINRDVSFEDWNSGWSATLALTGKIYDRAVGAQVDHGQQNETLIEIKTDNVRDLIRLEAEQALRNLKASLEKIRANQANIKLARESLRLTNARFEAEMGTTMDIIDAQLMLDKTLTGYYQGVVGYLSAQAKLELVMGKDI